MWSDMLDPIARALVVAVWVLAILAVFGVWKLGEIALGVIL